MDMPNRQQIESDIAFLREAVGQRNQQQYTSIAIAVLWAVIVAAGSVVNDFFIFYSGWYWFIAPTLGFFLSFYIGHRAARNCGNVSRRDGRAYFFHWGSMFIAAVAILSIAHHNNFTGWNVGQLFLLVSGLCGFLAGLHLDRRFLFPGLVAVLGSAAVDFVGPYPWTTVGFAFSASLIISAIWMRPPHEQADA